jgi:hypothetical protein
VADVSGRAGVTGTPTVKLNGQDISKALSMPGPGGPVFIAAEALVAMIKVARS